MVPPVSRRVPRAPRYSGCGLVRSAFRVRDCHPLRPGFPACSATPRAPYARPTTPPGPGPVRFGLLPVRSPLLGESRFVFSSWGYLDVSVPPVRPNLKVGGGLVPAGLPHSGIRGSKAICASPRLFAAYRALRRLRKPRYPPSALLYFLLAMPCGTALVTLLFFLPECQ